MTSSTSASTLFIDLATYSESEGFLYGGPESITYFVRSVQKANWFSFIPIQLRQQSTNPDFNQQNCAASVNRSGDYVLSTWFTALIPQIALGIKNTSGVVPNLFTDSSIRWTRYLMHNLFSQIWITFNELTLHQFDNYWLDFRFQFIVRGSKRVGYRNMVGDVASLTNPVGPGFPLGTGAYYSCPFPFWFAEDSGVALPIAALPFNDVKINYNIRNWTQLVVVYPGTLAVGGPGGPGTGIPATTAEVVQFGTTNTPSLGQPQTNAHYVVVHNDERVKMGDAPRDMLIYQTQEAPVSPFKDVTTQSSFDLRLSHGIVAFFFAAQNYTTPGEWSNYTTEPNYTGLDPLADSILMYENTQRLNMNSHYYSIVHPYYFAKAIPEEVGYHMWSYALHPFVHNPSGSTNYSKLANVSIVQTCSPAAINAANTTAPTDQFGNPIVYPNAAGSLVAYPQKFQHVFVVKNWNIARVANGSIGLPIL